MGGCSREAVIDVPLDPQPSRAVGLRELEPKWRGTRTRVMVRSRFARFLSSLEIPARPEKCALLQHAAVYRGRMPEESTWSIRDARQLIFGAWALYAVVWAVFLLPLVWAPAAKVLARGGLGAGILWIGAFLFALTIAFLGLSVGVVAGWVALRERPNRTWLNVTLVAVSILGLFAQAFYIKILLFG